jgi:hypothetical protein
MHFIFIYENRIMKLGEIVLRGGGGESKIYCKHIRKITVFLCVCIVLGFELRAYTLSHSTSLVCVCVCVRERERERWDFCVIGSRKLFPRVGLAPRSS